MSRGRTSSTGADGAAPQHRPRRHFAARLATFDQWPYNAVIDARDLAAAGFVYDGILDQVQCVYCRGRLHHWSRIDNPMHEHARHFPNCPFVLRHDEQQQNSQGIPRTTTSDDSGSDDDAMNTGAIYANPLGVRFERYAARGQDEAGPGQAPVKLATQRWDGTTVNNQSS